VVHLFERNESHNHIPCHQDQHSLEDLNPVALFGPAQQTRHLFNRHSRFFNLVAFGVTLNLPIAHVRKYCVSVFSLHTYSKEQSPS